MMIFILVTSVPIKNSSSLSTFQKYQTNVVRTYSFLQNYSNAAVIIEQL